MPPTESRAVLRLDAPELARRVADRLVPAHFAATVVGDLLADHRLRDRDPDASRSRTRSGPSRRRDPGSRGRRGSAAMRTTSAPPVTFELGLERAAHAAVRAGGRRPPARPGPADDRLLRSARRSGTPRRRRRTTRIRSPGTARSGSPATFDSKPRPWIVSANVPCTSSHARTQREQTMHSSGLKAKYGLLVVRAASDDASRAVDRP